MKIRKPVNELTLDDLKKYPAWEYALDEEGEEDQDETTVRPYEYAGKLDPAVDNCMVRASFVLADGTEMIGLITLPTPEDGGLDRMQPAIVTPNGLVGFWCGIFEPGERKAGYYRMLGRPAHQVFPLRFTSDVDCEGSPILGTVAGFMVLEDVEAGKVKTVT